MAEHPTNGSPPTINQHTNGNGPPTPPVGNGDHRPLPPNTYPIPVTNLLTDIVHNFTTMRADLFRRMFDPRRNLDDECGWPASELGSGGGFAISPDLYRTLYERFDIANRVVSLMSEECWQKPPTVYEDADKKTNTPFEQSWIDFGKMLADGRSWYENPQENHPVWRYCKKANRLSGIGSFGIILIGLNDGKNLEEPAEGVVQFPIYNGGPTYTMNLGRQDRNPLSPYSAAPVDSYLHPEHEKALKECKPSRVWNGRYDKDGRPILEDRRPLPLNDNEKAVLNKWRAERELVINAQQGRVVFKQPDPYGTPSPNSQWGGVGQGNGPRMGASPHPVSVPDSLRGGPGTENYPSQSYGIGFGNVPGPAPGSKFGYIPGQPTGQPAFQPQGPVPTQPHLGQTLPGRPTGQQLPPATGSHFASGPVSTPPMGPQGGQTGGYGPSSKGPPPRGATPVPPQGPYGPGGSLSGTDQQYFGVITGPTEMPSDTPAPYEGNAVEEASRQARQKAKEDLVKADQKAAVKAAQQQAQQQQPVMGPDGQPLPPDQQPGVEGAGPDAPGSASPPGSPTPDEEQDQEDHSDLPPPSEGGLSTALDKTKPLPPKPGTVPPKPGSAFPKGGSLPPQYRPKGPGLLKSPTGNADPAPDPNQGKKGFGIIPSSLGDDEESQDGQDQKGGPTTSIIPSHLEGDDDQLPPSEGPIDPTQPGGDSDSTSDSAGNNPTKQSPSGPGGASPGMSGRGPRQGPRSQASGAGGPDSLSDGGDTSNDLPDTSGGQDGSGGSDGLPPDDGGNGDGGDSTEGLLPYPSDGTLPGHLEFDPSSVRTPGMPDPNDPDAKPIPPNPNARRVTFLRVFDESLVQIVRYEWNVNNPRFGKPVMYRVTLNDPREQHSGVGLPLATVFVHWSRVIHVANTNANSSEVFATPEMRPVLNTLLDMRKIRGAAAEGYYKSCFQGLSFETHPAMGGDVVLDVQSLKDQYEQFINGLQRVMVSAGGSWKTIAPSVVDPQGQIAVGMEAIAVQKGIPLRVLKGAERGELASSQDDEDWNERKSEYQLNFLTPCIIVLLIDRLILMGVLYEPEKYGIEWPEIDALGETDRTAIALQKTQILQAYIAGQLESIISPMEFLTRIMGFQDDEAEAILDAAQMNQQTMTTPPPGTEGHPGSPPPPPPPSPFGPPNGGEPGEPPPNAAGMKPAPGKPNPFGGGGNGKPKPPAQNKPPGRLLPQSRAGRGLPPAGPPGGPTGGAA